MKRKMEDRMVRMKVDGRVGYVLMVLKSNTGKKMKKLGIRGTWTYQIDFSRTTGEYDTLLAKREEFDYIPGSWLQVRSFQI